jgi:hypothetical protein
MVDPTHVAALGPAAAILFARITWRSRETGSWRTTRKQMAEETGLTPDMIRAAVKVLRDREWASAERTSDEDPTLVWTPIHAGEAVKGNFPIPYGEIPHTPMGKFPFSSLETDKDIPPVSPPGGTDQPDEVDQPELFPVAAPTKTPRRRPRGPFPADFKPSPANLALAASLGVDLRVEGPRFQEHHAARGNLFADWHAALSTWIRNARKFADDRANVHPIRPGARPDGSFDEASWAAGPRPDPLGAQVGW